MKKTFLLLFIILSTTTFAQQKISTEKSIFTTIDNNAKILLEKSKAYSVSIGIVKDGKIYTKHYGELDKGKGNKANNDTYFEIASVTKVMTGYLLAKAVLESKVNLEDDIRKYLKGDYKNLEFNGKPIRIKDLISYESAIPSVLPDDRDIMRTFDDSTTFKLVKLHRDYTKTDFLRDLKTVKLDTIPGTKYNYSNPSLEITGLILENIYKKPFENLLKENLWTKLNMKHTKFALNTKEILVTGYNNNHILMPHFVSNLWGSSGVKTKSILSDLMQLLKFELEGQNKIVQETQRNIKNSNENWFGYFWDNIYISEFGKYCSKHGGAYGNQVMFSIFPEQNMGVCLIVNISGQETAGILNNAVFDIANDLLVEDKITPNIYGYKLTNDKVIFTYQHNQKSDSKLIKSISVAGSFNDWNPDNKIYQMLPKGNNTFELVLPKSQFEKGKEYKFKFVINKVRWITTPKNALNTDKTEDNNLTFRID